MKKWKVLLAFLLFFFLLPIVAGLLPLPNNEKYELPSSGRKLVYAAATPPENSIADKPTNISEPEQVVVSNSNPFNVLLLFTHSHETYKPFVADKEGKTAVYDTQSNLYSMKQRMIDYFQLNGITAKSLNVDVMSLLRERGLNINRAYETVRPHIKEELQKSHYDLVIDVHRDSIVKSASTTTYQQVDYAKIAFIIGLKNPNYKKNLSTAEKISKEMNNIVPNISRGIIKKGIDSGNALYNQDLLENMILVEIGGIENTEDEVYRTISVLAQSISKTLK